MTQNNHYEHKLVNVGEEVDNLIESLREQNKNLQIIVDSKKDVPEDFEHEKKVYQFRIDNLEKHNKKLQNDLVKGFELSLKEQGIIEKLKKKLTEGFNLQEVDTILDGLYYREDRCHQFIDTWGYKGNEKDEDVVSEKATLERTLTLIKYFEEMKTHIEECQSNMGD